MNEHDIILIEKYLSNELEGKELSNFEQRLQNEPELKRTVFADRFVEWSLRPHPLIRAKQIVDTLGDDLWTEDEKKNRREAEPEPSYNLDELMAMFASVEELETVAVSRSSQGVGKNPMQELVLLPENDIECKTDQLNFDFTDALPFAAELSITNNREVDVLNETIPQGVYEYTASLAGFAPGRYYWRLRATADNRKLRRTIRAGTGLVLCAQRFDARQITNVLQQGLLNFKSLVNLNTISSIYPSILPKPPTKSPPGVGQCVLRHHKFGGDNLSPARAISTSAAAWRTAGNSTNSPIFILKS